ncbi:hypothetical protein SDC9_155023 [bioreactor metagenome]|uniref:Uncharacterized protein n=1 Tax=bioreactor metagenome TaxID=1076179 RepID=A0A645F0F1_9ZZZZ
MRNARHFLVRDEMVIFDGIQIGIRQFLQDFDGGRSLQCKQTDTVGNVADTRF